MMRRVLMTRSNHPLQRTGAIKTIRQNDTICLMSGVTPETKKPLFLAVFYGGFEPLDSPYRNV
jgi:hypothetical protein